MYPSRAFVRRDFYRRDTMIIGKALIAAAALVLATPATRALAHDDSGYSGGYNGGGRHRQLHDELSEAHRRAHQEGFYSRAEHRAFHRALGYLHREYHEDYPSYTRRYWGWRWY